MANLLFGQDSVMHRRIQFRRWLIVLAVLAMVALPAALRAAGFTVSLEHDTLIAGESTSLTMSFEGGSPAAIPAIPPIPNLTIQDGGRSGMSLSDVNGVQTRTYTRGFVVTASQPGNYTIPSLAVTIDGQVYRSQPANLSVTQVPPPPTGVNPENPDIAFLRLYVPKQTVYVGEVLRGELQIYTRDPVQVDIRNGGANMQVSPPQAEGFTEGKRALGSQRATRIGKYPYTITPILTSFTAAKVGKLSIGPTECSVLLFAPPFDFFGNPTRRQVVTLTNTQITSVQSLPLPTENVPPGFSGAVGNYSLNVNVSPTNIAVGDPVTVKVEITGAGALEGITLPSQLGWQQFKQYPPTTDFQPADKLGISGKKTFAITAVPESMDVKELPQFVFTYFDPERKTYQTLAHGAVPLTIRPSAASLPPPSLAGIGSSDNPPAVMDVSPIKPRLGTLAQLNPPLVSRPWFLILQIIPAAAWVSLLIQRKRKENLANNPKLLRQRQVEQTVRAGLQELRNSASANQPATFFATIFRLLQERIGERLEVPASAITESVIEERLRPMGMPEELLARVRELFQVCNQARYSQQTSNEEMMSLIPKVEAVLGDLKKVKA